MTTEQVAKRYYELIQQHQYEQIQNELYAPNAVSIEPKNDSNLPLVVGLSYKNGQVVISPTFVVATLQKYDYSCLPG